MKNNYGIKMIASVLGISLMFLGVYQTAFAFTYGGGLLSTSRPSTAVAESVATVAIAPSVSTTAPTVSTVATPVAAKTTAAVKTPQKNAIPNFTLTELAKYDGQNGHKAYVAVDGVVYDMTLLGSWKNGQHHGVSAGTDLTAVFSKSPHAKSILKLAKVVGTLGKAKATAPAAAPAPTPAPAPAPAAAPTVAAVSSATSKSSTVANTTTQTTVKSSTGNQKPNPATWTLATLKQYNGTNGKPAYIAVNNTIYDVTNMGSWQGGTHHGITAGRDATQAFANSPHSKSLLSQLPVVGQIGKKMTTNSAVTTSVTTAKTQSFISDDHEDDEDDDQDGDDD